MRKEVHDRRFAAKQRDVPQTREKNAGAADRDKSVAAYQQYLKLHGPYEVQAREAIATLQSTK